MIARVLNLLRGKARAMVPGEEPRHRTAAPGSAKRCRRKPPLTGSPRSTPGGKLLKVVLFDKVPFWAPVSFRAFRRPKH